jgi:hypothetical protein
MSKTFELFHRIGDGESARVRKLFVDSGLSERVRFRNVGTSEEALGALRDVSGGDAVPTAVVFDVGVRERVLIGEAAIGDFVRELLK